MLPIRLLLVDDNPNFLGIAKDYLSEYPELEIIGTARAGEEVLELAPRLQPDVILLDLNLPGLTGFEIVPRLRAILPVIGIILLTLHDSRSYHEVAYQVGANAFVAKANLLNDLVPVIHTVAQQTRQSAARA